MNRTFLKCSCYINRNSCPLHGINKGDRRQIIKHPFVTLPPSIKHGDGTLHKRISKITWKDLTWTNEELKKMSKEKLWTVACLLQIPHRNPTINKEGSESLDLLRHIKAALGMYKQETMENSYYITYPTMRGIVPLNRK